MKEKQISIDILRILCMCGIIGLHVLNNGGVTTSLTLNSLTGYTIHFYRALLYTSVNLFAIISGYVNYNKTQIKPKRILSLWGIVLFYSNIITIITLFIHPDFLPDSTSFIRSIFPPIEGRYWYITNYTLVFFLIPFINKLVSNNSFKENMHLVTLLFVFLSIVSCFGFYDYFRISSGYSSFWLIFCYLIGATIQKHSNELPRISTKKLLLILFISLLISSQSINLYYHVNNTIQHYLREKDWLIGYNSPFTLINSIIIFVIISNIHKTTHNKIISNISAATFSIYIIHSHPIIYDFYIKDSFKYIASHSPLSAVIRLTLVILFIFLVCYLIDAIRSLIFYLIKSLSKNIQH